MIKLYIDGKEIKIKSGRTVLEAALEAGIYIPNLCYHPEISPIGACRLCIVEIKGMKGFPTSCTTIVEEGMVIYTNTSEIQEFRKNIMWLILSEHPRELNESSQLKKVAEWVGGKEMLSDYIFHPKNLPVISDDPLFNRDLNRCILCGRCVSICQEVRKTGVLGFINRGITTTVSTSYDLLLKDADCKFCGACVEVCPSGALIDKEKYEEEEREKVLLPCTNTCPAGIDVARYIRLIAEEKLQDAIEVVREKVPFPYVLGCVCNHPCEEVCRRGDLNEPISIKELKRFVAERDSRRWRSKITISSETGKKIAIIGSGPAGLTAAWFLRKSGHSATVFEALAEPGGTIRTCIPEYRLPRNILDQEIKDIENIGVKIKTNTKIESLDDLFNQGFNAIFVALGVMEGIKMGIQGEDDPRILDGTSMLRSMNLNNRADITGEVLVVGGGNVAIDAARSVLRLGAKKVIIMYRRTQEEMPASQEEVEEALEEGVKIKFLQVPQKVSAEHNRLKTECIRMELGETDASGRRRPIPVKGSEFIIKVDRIIMAIGQRSVVSKEFGLLTDEKGRILVDPETLSCSKKGVFSGGDVVSGPSSVIEAIQAGRKAAISIDRYLGGKGQIDQKFVSEKEEGICLGREEGFAYRNRAEIPMLSVDKRLHNFLQVECGLDEKTAVEEAKRCLRCQLRIKMKKAPMPPDKNK